MSLSGSHIDEIVRIKPRERGGVVSSNRMEYQRNWTLCYLLKIHEEKKDYTILLDYHDDLVAIENAESLRSIDFFQLKTDKNRDWTLTTLLKRPKNGDNLGHSICGKMYSNRMQFPERTRSLNFISNRQFNVSLKELEGKSILVDEFEVEKLSFADHEKFKAAIMNEFNLSEVPPLDVRIFFRRDSLSWDGHDKQTLGELVEYLDKRCPNGKFATKAAFEALQSVITKKSSNERKFESAAELIAEKGITRDEFEKMIEIIIGSEERSLEKADAELRSLLGRETSFTAGEIMRLQAEWKKYAVQRLDVANPSGFALQKIIADVVVLFKTNNPNCTMRELVDNCYIDVAGHLSGTSPFKEDYIKGAILLEFNER